ncbi:DUF2179 domain-containing protein [Indiicoccus explosivorum]|uniref:DUF2179 domain-containing protein n=1 Tax=Indiicoccus explosivorum TaxID=1917864 RepID=UPI000B435B46|nr:DUF2179 domain-containing protein [Indiicoccus explosivorum]
MVLIIFTINIVYVTIATIRMILTLKGYRYIAAAVSMVETTINVIALGLVLENLNEIQNLIAYAVGFGSGVVVGSKIEEKLALGYSMVNVITVDESAALPGKLRDKGYGVTDWQASGLDGSRKAMQILTPRKYELKLYQTIKELDPKAFIFASEPKTIHGGFWTKSIRKGPLAK